jgi:hypothetical protein
MQGFRSGQRQVEYTSFRKRTTIIHHHDNAALRSGINNAQARAKGEATVRRGEFRRIILVATGGAAEYSVL